MRKFDGDLIERYLSEALVALYDAALENVVDIFKRSGITLDEIDVDTALEFKPFSDDSRKLKFNLSITVVDEEEKDESSKREV